MRSEEEESPYMVSPPTPESPQYKKATEKWTSLLIRAHDVEKDDPALAEKLRVEARVVLQEMRRLRQLDRESEAARLPPGTLPGYAEPAPEDAA